MALPEPGILLALPDQLVVAGLAGFLSPGILPQISPPKSPHLGKTPPHIDCYIAVDDKNKGNDVEIRPYRGKCMRRRTGETHASTEGHEPGLYEIRVKGHLNEKWAAWFEGLTITLQDNGDTLLTGPVVDQAALHGVLKKVRDLGLPLISINQVQL